MDRTKSRRVIPERGLDLAPLSAPVTRDELRMFRQTIPGAGMPRLDPASPGPRAWMTTALVALFTVPFAVVPCVMLLTAGPGFWTVAGALLGALITFGSILILGRFRWPRFGARLWRDRLRLVRFAERNGARFTASMDTEPRPGMIFGRGERRRSFDVVEFAHPRRWRVGNLSYQKVLPRGGAEQHLWGFVEMTLPRRFPHIVLDSLANNGIRGRELENPYAGQGAIALEGDFSDHFRLTCPPGYERDALYLLTPDLMAVLIDEGADFDIEIVDDVLFLYRPRLFALADPGEWARIQRILDTIGAGTAKRTGNYRDERVGNRGWDVIAPEGSRLPQPRLLLAGLLVAAVFILFTILGALFGGQ